MIEFINTNLAYFGLIAVLLALIHLIIHKEDDKETKKFFEEYNISLKRRKIFWVFDLVFFLVFFFYFLFNVI